MARLTKYEQETIINFNEDEATASVYTYNPALRRKLSQLAQERRPQECVLDESHDYSGALVCTIPKRWVKITPNRILSEAEKAQRFQALRNANFGSKSPGQPQKTEHTLSPEGNYTPDIGEGACQP